MRLPVKAAMLLALLLALSAACTAEKECVLVEGAQHGCSYVRDRARVEAALRTFLERHTKGEDGHDKPA